MEMKTFSVIAIVLLLASIIAIQPAEAEAKIITVPDDYPTIASAIGNASDGNTILVKKGTYHEQTLHINKSISLIGEGVQETIVNLDPPLEEVWIFSAQITLPMTAITIDTDNFTLSGFTINMPAGMSAKNGSTVAGGLVANGDRISLAGNKLTSSLQLTGNLLNITDNEITRSLKIAGSNQSVINNSIADGLETQGSFNQIIENTITQEINVKGSSFNLIIGNSFLMMYLENCNSNFIASNSFKTIWLGLHGNACSNNTVSANKITGPALWGILMGAGSYNVFHDNRICNFSGSYGIAIGGNHLVAEHNTFYRNILTDNKMNVGTNWEVLGAGNFWDNGEVGNFWDDYVGTDSDGDGIGDIPHAVEGCKWDDSARGHVDFVFGQDSFPLIAPFDVDNVNIQLPEWVTPTTAPSSPLPSTQPSLSPSSSPSENLNVTPPESALPSPPPSIPELPAWTIILVIAIVLAFFTVRKKASKKIELETNAFLATL